MQRQLVTCVLIAGTLPVLLAGFASAPTKAPASKAAEPTTSWELFRADARRSVEGQGALPRLDQRLWSRPTILDKSEFGTDEHGREAKAWIDRALQQANANPRQSLLPGFFPIAVGNKLCYRTYSGITSVLLKNSTDSDGTVCKAGDIYWKSTDMDGALGPSLAEPKYNGLLKSWLEGYKQAALLDVVCGNTLAGTLSSDGQQVYAVDDLAVPGPRLLMEDAADNPRRFDFAEWKPLVMENSLHAYDLPTGKEAWHLGHLFRQRATEFADSHFLGLPLPVGGKLYVLNEKHQGFKGDAELRLVCLQPATGEVVPPVLKLGVIPEKERVTHNPVRRLNAVHLASADGVLVCPGNAGTLFGVELPARRLLWTYKYGVKKEEQPPPVRILPGAVQSLPIEWYAATPVLADGKVVFTAPEDGFVHCLNLRDGTQLWKAAREEDLYLAGVFGNRVLLVGKESCRALGLADGKEKWKLTTGVPSGVGAASGGRYYLPLRSAAESRRPGVCAIDVAQGKVVAAVDAPGKEAPGNLIFHDGQVLVQTATTISAYPEVTARD